MTLILSGTDSSVSAPAVQGGTAGTTTGVYYPATNQLALATNGTQALLVDSSQNVGIGTSSPSVKLHVKTTAQVPVLFESTQTEVNIRLDNSSATGNYFGATSGANFYWSSGGTERMRIDSSGNVGIGVTPSARLQVTGSANTYAGSGLLLGSAGVSSGYIQTTDNLYIKPNTSTNTTSGVINFQNFSGTTTNQISTATGNITFFASNAGIVFNNSSATTNSTLNDYEYGTYTVTDASGAGLTLSTNRAYYVKVGRNVYISASVTYPSNSSGSQVKMSIPFNSAINSFYAGNGATGYTSYSTVITLPIIENGGVNVLFNKNPSMSGLLNSDLSGLRIDYTVSYVGSF